MDAWLFKAEERMGSSEEIKSGYDKVSEQLEEHQVLLYCCVWRAVAIDILAADAE